MANKLTTMGYFVKRLRDSGYMVDKLFDSYALTDPRTWTIVIDPRCASIFCTCYQNSPELGDFYFELYDGGQFINGRLSLKTSSIETFVEWLVKFGINNKAGGYPEKRYGQHNSDRPRYDNNKPRYDNNKSRFEKLSETPPETSDIKA